MKKNTFTARPKALWVRTVFLSALCTVFYGCYPQSNSDFYAVQVLPVKAEDAINEGVHYHPISIPFATNKPEIRAFFSYGCPHCYLMHPIIKTLREKHGISVRMHHVPLLKSFNTNMQQSWSAGLLLARDIGQEDAYHDAMFDAVHVQRNPVVDREFVSDFFVRQHGVSAERVATALSDLKALSADDALSKKLLARGDIKGVPAFIVNGKYRIDMASVSNADVSADLAAIYSHLQSKGN